MNLVLLLNAAVLLAGVLLSVGVYLNFGLGWALICGGLYLAYNTISTIKALNVRTDQTEE